MGARDFGAATIPQMRDGAHRSRFRIDKSILIKIFDKLRYVEANETFSDGWLL